MAEENFGEDPALVAAMGVAATTGLHGGNTGGASSYLPNSAIVSEAKHAAAYGFGGRDGSPADLSPRTLHDVYLRPWREYVAAGGRGAMMSHNSINGLLTTYHVVPCTTAYNYSCMCIMIIVADIPAHMNSELMQFLRQSGGPASAGMLIASDECDVANLQSFQSGSRGFGLAANLSHAGALAMSAGLDQEFCFNGDNANLAAFVGAENLVRTGMIKQSVLDRAAANVLRAKFVSPPSVFFIDHGCTHSHAMLSRRRRGFSRSHTSTSAPQLESLTRRRTES
eukprot:SAG31_NODE_1455_length_8278_cov_2.514366_3_plen_282_part_00